MNAWMHVAGWVLIHFVWQGTVVAMTAALVLHLCRHRSASTRYAIACGALTMMILCAAATAAITKPPVSSSEPTRMVVPATLHSRADVLLPIEITDGPRSA